MEAGNIGTLITAIFAVIAAVFAILTWFKKADTAKFDADAAALKDSARQSGEKIDQMQGGLKVVFDLPQVLESRLDKMRESMENSMESIRSSNELALEKMRETVNEKLQKTLEERLHKSFGFVSDRLKAVHLELGKMETLSNNVGKLTNILSNAPARGVIGEINLKAILEEVLSTHHYEKNAKIDPLSNERVEFAIRIPESENERKLLPVDSKFPLADYERYISALKDMDKKNAGIHRNQLIRQISAQAKNIKEKYIKPPHSTDFAILFLPTEGLYSVVANESGAIESLYREHQVRIVGPHNFHDMLSAIRAGLHLFEVSQQSKEVREVLISVKTEFDNFADALSKAQQSFITGMNKLDEVAGKHTRKMKTALNQVDQLPES